MTEFCHKTGEAEGWPVNSDTWTCRVLVTTE